MKQRLHSLSVALVMITSLGLTVPLRAQNNPPVLTANNLLTVTSGVSGPITPALLAATDNETGPDLLRFTVAPGGQGSSTYNGTLQCHGTNLTAGDFFTQSDINLGQVVYRHNGNCAGYDNFTFNISDGAGGVTPTGEHTTFTFGILITHPNLPPVTQNGGGGTGLLAPFHGILSATNTDCLPQTLGFRIETPPGKGDLTLDNTNTGAFTYTPRSGEQGEDSFTFQVNDGLVDAASPGTFSITITNTLPAGVAGSGTTRENISFSGILSGSDSDLPAQPLTFSIVTNGGKGTVVITDASTGTFAYTPTPSAIGADTFAFTVSDGTLTSPPATFNVNIRPNLEEGDLLVTDRGSGVVLIDPSGAQVVVSSGGLLQDPRGIVVASDGTIVVMDGANGLLRINPLDGAQSIWSPHTNFTEKPIGAYGIAVEPSGAVVVADGVNGVVRVDPVTGQPTVLTAGDLLQLPIGVAVSPRGEIYVSDGGGLMEASSQIVRVNPVTGIQTLVSSGGDLLLPVGIAWEPSGTLVVADAPALLGLEGNLVLRINPTNGNQTFLSASNLLAGPIGVAVGTNGAIYTANILAGTIVSLDPVTGLQSVFASGDALAYPAGITVVPNPNLNHLVGIVPAAGQIQINFQGHPNESYALERSTNLSSWEQVALSGAGEDGLVQFVDDDPPAGGACYRVRWQ